MIHVCISPHGNVVRIDVEPNDIENFLEPDGRGFRMTKYLRVFWKMVDGKREAVAVIPGDWAVVEERAYVKTDFEQDLDAMKKGAVALAELRKRSI